jgi:hypothetical protein
MATVYIVLRSEGGKELYAPIGEQEAGNDQAAITSFLAVEEGGTLRGEKYGEGDYRAVPKRSWAKDPRPVRKQISFG